MATTKRGLILISDITGYTSFLNSSELEHAQDSLRSLLELLIDHTNPPLVISRLEGDAVISYSLEGSFLQGQTIVEMLERTYTDFRRALELMVLNTTCNCNACRNIANLDLKFFVHYGSFILEPLQSYTELVGPDVNLLHRLTKNSISEQTNIKAYVLYTRNAVDDLGINEIAESMTKHVETHDGIGDVNVYVQDMHPVWEEAQSRSTMSVQPEDSYATIEMDYQVSPLRMWDYVTGPEYKAILAGSKSADVGDKRKGRIGEGAIYYCAHGKSITHQMIVDWRPPDEYSYTTDPFLGMAPLTTIRLEPNAEGTRVSILVGEPSGGLWIVRAIFRLIMKPILIGGMTINMQKLQQRIETELEEGIVLQTESRNLPSDELEKAVRESLALQ
jgi:hypothetical protein